MQLSADDVPNITGINELIKQIFSTNTADTKSLFKQTLNAFKTAIKQGYGKDFGNIAYNTPDFEVLSNLNYNVGVFAAFKNHDQLKETVSLLKDEDGRIRDFKSFEKEALKLNQKYNRQWLRVEYDQAITSARAAKRWQEFERTKDLYPNLKYVAVNDERTRQLHRNWDGIILPLNHPFWQTHYPPNDYGCRCVVRRTDAEVNAKGVVVNDMPNLPPQFNTNVGTEGKVFNDEHPYYKTTNFKGVVKAANSALLKEQRTEIRSHLKDQGIIGSLFKSKLGEIKVTNSGIKEILGQGSKNKYLRNNLLYDLKAVLKDATYVKNGADLKNNAMVKQYHYLLISSGNFEFYLNVRELTTGEYILYSITDGIK